MNLRTTAKLLPALLPISVGESLAQGAYVNAIGIGGGMHPLCSVGAVAQEDNLGVYGALIVDVGFAF